MAASPLPNFASSKSLAVSQRIEAKYFLTEVEADLVRDHIAAYTDSDRDHPEYRVTSIYLDTPDNAFLKSSEHGERNRFKLRVRSYESDTPQPVFAEVKQRIGRVVCKHRATLRHDALGSLHWSELPGRNALVQPDSTKDADNLLLFSDLAQRYRAEPRVCVGYRRTAFVSAFDEPVRITFDDQIGYAEVPDNPSDLWASPIDWKLIDHLPIVLEIKFTDNFPFWVRQLVQRFQLKQTSLAKYVECVYRMDKEFGGTQFRPSEFPGLRTY